MKKVLTTWNLLIVCAVGIVACLLFPWPRTQWLGGYFAGTFTFEFKDQNGKPVKDVHLEVTDAWGESLDKEKVKDFDKDGPARSDDNGRLKVHISGSRFGGTCMHYFFIIPAGQCNHEGPVIYCRFFHGGKEVFATTYKALHKELVNNGQHGPDNSDWSLRKTIVIEP